jgi:hypothetical protein
MSIKNNIAAYYTKMSQQYSAKYVKEATIGIGLLAALIGGYFLNSWYVKNREEQAFKDFSSIVSSMQQNEQIIQALDPQKDKEKIDQAYNDVLLLIDALYKEHVGSYLAPYFLALKSQIILEQTNNYQEAVTILDQALNGMDKKSDLGSLYYLKRIKMGFDSTDTKEQEKSFKELEILANDQTNVMQQEAQYLLGAYYASLGQITQAQEVWKKLINASGELSDRSDDTDLLKSSWIKLAQEKLGLGSEK